MPVPVAPVAPVAPAAPFRPFDPEAPVAPVAPAAPAGPVAPVAPVTPWVSRMSNRGSWLVLGFSLESKDAANVPSETNPNPLLVPGLLIQYWTMVVTSATT